MDTESVALASTAAATIVTLLTTDAWTQVKKEVAGLWRRFRPEHAAAVEDDLSAARQEALAAAAAGDEAVPRALATEWESRLRRLLAAEPAAASELAQVVATLTSIKQHENVMITQKANASDQSQVRGHCRLARTGNSSRSRASTAPPGCSACPPAD
jgi:hypothetical protein